VPDLPRSHLVAYALAAILVLAFGWQQVSRGGGDARPAPAPAEVRMDRDAPGDTGRLVVHVAGAVVRPGVYRLRAGARVHDAVERAGGARRRADLTQLNLAAELEDGRQVLVPERPRAGGATGAAAAAGAGAAGSVAGPLNLNTATLEQLDTLDGVGPVTAQKILDYRQEHGGFSSVDELGRIPGIGEVRMAALREKVRV
jgi:competence protein ComEA